jgi:tight adherence protein B
VRAGDVIAVLAIGALVFFAALLALGARRSKSVMERLRAHIPELEEPDAEPDGRTPVTLLARVADHSVSKLGVRRRLEAMLERAGSSLSAGQLALTMGGSALAGGLLVRLVGLPPALALLALPVGGVIPYAVLHHRGVKRRGAFDDQLPDLLLTMAASTRVGHTFRQAMQTIVTEGEEPAAAEFRRVLVETDVGRPLERALAEMAERIGSRNFAFVVNVVTIQREVGGSLAGLFDLVSETVRNRQQFAKKVRALTATGRISAYVILAMPFVAAGFMSLLHGGYLSPFFTTSAGRMLLIVAIGGMVVGAIVIKKMVSFRLG